MVRLHDSGAYRRDAKDQKHAGHSPAGTEFLRHQDKEGTTSNEWDLVVCQNLIELVSL